ncbi:MAG TPA: lipid-A-disaccharide synthase [Candidatus Binatus sp.]|jgi:lipid-A-disaccharide synthase|nr:lipid-A-disaccharide synthase [Candidatus Binatus sp.]
MTEKQILISAGEASSDMYAARLVTALRERVGPHARFFGMGGPRMAEAGVELIADYHEVAVLGLAEVLHKIPTVIGVQNRLKREAKRRNAALAILVDSPGTHLGVARRMKQMHVPVGYFIGPQIWAWRAGRVRIVKRRVNRMVVIFPFEEKIYREAGVPVSFVGHPLVDVVRPSMTRAEFAALHKLDPNKPILTILPGSRGNEIRQNYGRILSACERLKRGNRNIQFVLAVAPNLSADFFSAYASSGVEIKHLTGATYDALAAADCAIVASGTATIEASLLGTPMIVIYRVSPLSAFLLGRMIRTPFFSMVNLIAGQAVVRELIQDQFTPEAVESEVRRLLESSRARDRMKASLAEVRAKLGPGGAIARAADIFAQML